MAKEIFLDMVVPPTVVEPRLVRGECLFATLNLDETDSTPREDHAKTLPLTIVVPS